MREFIYFTIMTVVHTLCACGVLLMLISLFSKVRGFFIKTFPRKEKNAKPNWEIAFEAALQGNPFSADGGTSTVLPIVLLRDKMILTFELMVASASLSAIYYIIQLHSPDNTFATNYFNIHRWETMIFGICAIFYRRKYSKLYYLQKKCL